MWRSLVLASAVLVGGCDKAVTDTGNGLVGDPVAGATVYADNCAGCHGADGTGGGAPDLTAAVPGYSAEELTTIVTEGQGKMPAQTQLTEQQVADVVAYLQDEF